LVDQQEGGRVAVAWLMMNQRKEEIWDVEEYQVRRRQCKSSTNVGTIQSNPVQVFEHPTFNSSVGPL
jgi:hypothetical protein